MKNSILIISCFLILIGCNQPIKKPANTATVNKYPDAPDVIEHQSILQIDPKLNQADSLVFIFYKNPHTADSLRYTRYYTQLTTTDSSLINFTIKQLTNHTVKFEKIKKCRSEGKIWCFSKGQIFQTIYFSSKDAQCSFLYIIKHGFFYYSTINKSMVDKLVRLKPMSKEI